MKRLLSTSLLALAVLMPAAAQAHRSWLMPSTTQLDGKDPYVTVDGGVSENLFQTDAFALKLDGLTITAPDGSSVPPEDVATLKQRASFDVRLSQDGTWRIAVSNDTVMYSYSLNGELKRGRGAAADLATLIPAGAGDVRVSHMLGRFETWVSANTPSDGLLKPAGKGLEIVPLSNPSGYVAGEAAGFRAYLDGKPLAGLAVQVIPGGVRYRGDLQETDVTTDAKGEFTVTWPIGQMYWIGASWPPRPSHDEGGHEGGGQDKTPGGPGGEGHGPQGPVEPGDRYSYAGTFEVMPF